MSDKVYLGKRVSAMTAAPTFDGYSRVTIIVGTTDEDGEELVYTAGDDTGRELEIENPWGTQAMAAAILARVRGYAYQPYTASGALLDPAAELGDGVTINGLYSLLAAEEINFSAQNASEISAPKEEEIDHEYPYQAPADREIRRSLAKTVSEFTVSYNSIAARVGVLEDDAGDYIEASELTITASGITLTHAGRTAQMTLGDYLTSSTISTSASGIQLQYTKSDGSTTTGSTISISYRISVESGDVSIKANRLTVESDKFTLKRSGEVSAIGSFTTTGKYSKYDDPTIINNYKAILESGFLKYYKDGSYLGGIQSAVDLSPSSSGPYDYSGVDIITNSDAITLSVDSGSEDTSNTYYFALNNGLNPGGYTERIYINDDVRVCATVKAWNLDLVAANGSIDLAYGKLNSADALYINGGLIVTGDLLVKGTHKTRVVETKNYGARKLNAMESASSVFADIGSGQIDESGKCYVFIDPVFAETVELMHEYQVFVTTTSDGRVDWIEKSEIYFVVHGIPGTTFDWILYARQKSCIDDRLECFDGDEPEPRVEIDKSIFYQDNAGANQAIQFMETFATDYDALAEQYLRDYEREVDGT